MIKYLYILFISFFVDFIYSQQLLDNTFEKKFNWSNEIFVGIDKFNDVYFIKNQVLNKTNDTQNWQFKDYNLGEIYQVDLTNPLQILVFYKNFQTIVVLDNQLNEIRRISINAENNFFINSIGMSIQNKIWFFDEKFQKFGLYDMQKKHWEVFPYIIKHSPVQLMTSLNQLYWLDEKQNLYQLSIFGQVKKIYSFDLDIIVHDIFQSIIYYEIDNKFFQYNFETNNHLEIKIPLENFDKIMFKKQKMFIFTNTNFYIYQIN